MSAVKSLESEPTTILVLGMHRSGTSLVADMLRRGGVALGSEDRLAGPAEDNPRGFFEHLEIRSINEELLERIGGSWRSPPEAAAVKRTLVAPAFADLRSRAQAIVDELRTNANLWGWKDPRTSLLLPFWREVVPTTMRAVVCLRDPRSVADSLAARNGIPKLLAFFLWQEYLSRLLDDLEGMPAVVVGYREILSDPTRQAERIAASLSLPSKAVDVEAMAAAVDSTLDHHAEEREAAFESPWEGGEALWGDLQKCALDTGSLGEFEARLPPRDESFTTMMKDSGVLAARLAELENQSKNSNREIQDLHKAREDFVAKLAEADEGRGRERAQAREAHETMEAKLAEAHQRAEEEREAAHAQAHEARETMEAKLAEAHSRMEEDRERARAQARKLRQEMEEERNEARAALDASRALFQASQEHLLAVDRQRTESLDRAQSVDAVLQQVLASRGWRALEWLRGWKRMVVRGS